MKARGFSLIELTVVLALLAFMLCIGSFYGSFMYRVIVRQEVEKLALICRYLQQSAMVGNLSRVLTFDVKKNGYMYDGCYEKLPNSVEFGTVPGVKGPPANPDHQIQSPITFKDERIVFHPDGIIQAGTVYLISKDRQIMYALSCPVSQVSYMRIYEYDGFWKCVS